MYIYIKYITYKEIYKKKLSSKIFTPNVFSFVDGVQAVWVIRKLDRTRCMSILHHLNGENTVCR